MSLGLSSNRVFGHVVEKKMKGQVITGYVIETDNPNMPKYNLIYSSETPNCDGSLADMKKLMNANVLVLSNLDLTADFSFHAVEPKIYALVDAVIKDGKCLGVKIKNKEETLQYTAKDMTEFNKFRDSLRKRHITVQGLDINYDTLELFPNMTILNRIKQRRAEQLGKTAIPETNAAGYYNTTEGGPRSNDIKVVAMYRFGNIERKYVDGEYRVNQIIVGYAVANQSSQPIKLTKNICVFQDKTYSFQPTETILMPNTEINLSVADFARLLTTKDFSGKAANGRLSISEKDNAIANGDANLPENWFETKYFGVPDENGKLARTSTTIDTLDLSYVDKYMIGYKVYDSWRDTFGFCEWKYDIGFYYALSDAAKNGGPKSCSLIATKAFWWGKAGKIIVGKEEKSVYNICGYELLNISKEPIKIVSYNSEEMPNGYALKPTGLVIQPNQSVILSKIDVSMLLRTSDFNYHIGNAYIKNYSAELSYAKTDEDRLKVYYKPYLLFPTRDALEKRLRNISIKVDDLWRVDDQYRQKFAFLEDEKWEIGKLNKKTIEKRGK